MVALDVRLLDRVVHHPLPVGILPCRGVIEPPDSSKAVASTMGLAMFLRKGCLRGDPPARIPGAQARRDGGGEFEEGKAPSPVKLYTP